MWTLIFPKQETAYAFLLSTCFVHILIYFYREVSIPPCLGVHSYPHRRNMNPFKMKQGRTCSWDHFCCWCPIFLFKLTRHTQPAFKGWIIPAFYNIWSSPNSTFQNTQNNKQFFCKVFVMFWLLSFCLELTLCNTGCSCVCSYGLSHLFLHYCMTFTMPLVEQPQFLAWSSDTNAPVLMEHHGVPS